MTTQTREIIRLRVEGMSVPEIANQLGVTVRGVHWALDEHVTGPLSPLERMRTIDVDLMRLDELQKAFFPQAKAGEIDAGALMVKTQERR
jgi:hypothetical protein